jgi:hypothetical protein
VYSELSYSDVERFIECGPLILSECDKITNNQSGELLRINPDHSETLLSQLSEIDVGDAYSYRNFLVAAGFLAFDGDEKSGVYVRGNLKEQGKEKSCAERNAEAALRRRGFIRSAGLIVQASADIDLIHAVTGVATPTLHPCPDLCQPILATSRIIPVDMPVITIADDGSRFQAFVLSDMLKAYDDDNYEKLMKKNIGGRIDFFEALVSYRKILRQAEMWKNKPTPGELAVTALLDTAR